MKRVVTRVLIVVAAILGIVFAQVAPASANAPADPSGKLAGNLAALWTAALETPASENPAAGNGSPCWNLGHQTVAPFFGPLEFSCTVKAGTKLFVVGWSTECSNIPNDTDGGVNLAEPALRQCARDAVAKKKPKVTLDGRDVPLTEVETPALHPVLLADNILGAPKGEYLSVADGLVALLHPLTPGEHTIEIVDLNDPPAFPKSTTTINVEQGH
jgi:hypothetical protein